MYPSVVRRVGGAGDGDDGDDDGDGDADADDDDGGDDGGANVDGRGGSTRGGPTRARDARRVRCGARGEKEDERGGGRRAHQGAVAERLRPSHPGKRARDG